MKIECNGFFIEVEDKIYTAEGAVVIAIPKDTKSLNQVYRLMKATKAKLLEQIVAKLNKAKQ